jgi:aspartyl/asparaginyl beta-hydroxylase (cupin superfamily)
VSHVPRTRKLLEDLVGTRYLRTALFSRLAPHSVLEAHTGWADLANHVLRLHIPLVVPRGGDGCHDDDNDDGLCGTWVDGCVETHAVGRALLFDDSKIHRAFNYSNADRLVLIVDLARPEHLPPGYASGGHSEELDAFIAQMSVPK